MTGEAKASARLLHGVYSRLALLLALALMAGLAVLVARQFLGEPRPARWSQCLWREAPSSAANWVAMDPVGTMAGRGEPLPAELLKARLMGACAAILAPAGKSHAAGPDWPGLRAALAGSIPQIVGEDRSDPHAFVCEVFFADDASLRDVAEHDWGFGDFNTGSVIGRRSHYRPAQHYGQTLTATTAVRFCRLIGPDGRPGRDRFQRAPLTDRAAG